MEKLPENWIELCNLLASSSAGDCFFSSLNIPCLQNNASAEKLILRRKTIINNRKTAKTKCLV